MKKLYQRFYGGSNQPANRGELLAYGSNLISIARTEVQLGIEETFLDEVENSLKAFAELLDIQKKAAAYGKELTEQLHELEFADHHNALRPLKIGDLAAKLRAAAGLRKFLDELARQILASEFCTEEIKKRAGLVPTPKTPVDPKDLVADGDAECDGAGITCTCHIVEPATSYSISLDKHDGEGMKFVNVSERYEFRIDDLELPAVESIWTLRLALRVKGRDTGTALYLNLKVRKT